MIHDMTVTVLRSGRRLFDAVGVSSVRDGPDDSSIAVDLVDASSFVPKGTADASTAGATATQVQLTKVVRVRCCVAPPQ